MNALRAALSSLARPDAVRASALSAALGLAVATPMFLFEPAPAKAAPHAVGAAAAPHGALKSQRAVELVIRRTTLQRPPAPLQCAIYARQRTGLQLTGAARTWWPQAAGRYQRAATPSVGAVMVMGGTKAGHVAVVTRVVNARHIAIDHANWLGEGEIITGALVEDVSPANDWSAVRVWNVETNSMGVRAYPVFGFVGPDAV